MRVIVTEREEKHSKDKSDISLFPVDTRRLSSRTHLSLLALLHSELAMVSFFSYCFCLCSSPISTSDWFSQFTRDFHHFSPCFVFREKRQFFRPKIGSLSFSDCWTVKESLPLRIRDRIFIISQTPKLEKRKLLTLIYFKIGKRDDATFSTFQGAVMSQIRKA